VSYYTAVGLYVIQKSWGPIKDSSDYPLSSPLGNLLVSFSMNSEVTLTNYSITTPTKGRLRLVFKRNDPCHAVLLEHGVPRFFLATSDGLHQVKICDRAQRLVADVNSRMFLKDVFTFGNRNAGRVVRVSDVLRKAPATKEG
jgi:hypothetical protein